MGLIQCPECGSKISSRATACPHCGYVSCDSTLPISIQDTYEIIPILNYDIQEWEPLNDDLTAISPEDNRTLFEFLTDWKNIELLDLADTIRALASRETVMVADIKAYLKKLISEGFYRFSIDKNGEILPTIRDAKKIIKQVRLKEMTLFPGLMQSFSNLTTHAIMSQILDEIKSVGEAIQGIHIELQNDRLAMAESARDKFSQAMRIQDAKLREMAVVCVIQSATDAKRVLIRNFAENLRGIANKSKKTVLQMTLELSSQKGISGKASDAFHALVSITNVVQIECEGYALLGEYESSKECLSQFRGFIQGYKLDQRDTLLMLNENLKHKSIQIVNQFSDISKRIMSFEHRGALQSDSATTLLMEEKQSEN